MTKHCASPLYSGSARESFSPRNKNAPTAPDAFSSPLDQAALCKEQAEQLVPLVERLDDSIRSVDITLSAADAVERLLLAATRLIEAGRVQPDPAGRKALAALYGEIVTQIDGLAFDAECNGRNLAAGDIIDIAFEKGGAETFEIADVALTAASLGLASTPAELTTNADIVRQMSAVENARSTLATRKITLETAISVLQSRFDFSQAKLRSLRSAGETLLRDGRTRPGFQEIAAHQVAVESVGPSKLHGISKDQVRNDNEESFSREMANPECEESDANQPAEQARRTDEDNLEADIGEIQALILRLDDEPANGLDGFAVELARNLDEDAYPGLLSKYDTGERDAFVSHLAKNYGPALIEKAKVRYAQDDAFKANTDRYMRAYESGLEETISGDAEPTKKIDSCLKTDYGWVYILLARAVGMV